MSEIKLIEQREIGFFWSYSLEVTVGDNPHNRKTEKKSLGGHYMSEDRARHALENAEKFCKGEKIDG